LLTSDPIYYKPLVPKITIKDLAANNTHYTYDPFTDTGTVNKPISLSVNLSENTHGTFAFQIEDENNTLDTTKINKGARLIIEVGKQASQMTRLFSGLIRKTGRSRGSNEKNIYNLFGSSTGIRLNERIIYYVKAGDRGDVDGVTIDMTDPTIKADAVIYNAFQSLYTALPALTQTAEAALGILSVQTLQNDSDVENPIADVRIEYGELMDLISLVEEHTNADFYISPDDKGYLRYEIRPGSGGRGFTIKNKNEQYDDADDTCYLIRKNWNYDESTYKQDAYSNRIFSILPPSKTPLPETNLDALGMWNCTVTHIAQKFKPQIGRIFADSIEIGGRGQTGPDWTTSVPITMQILSDTGGLPTNTNGVLYVLYCKDNPWGILNYNTTSKPAILSDFVYAIYGPAPNYSRKSYILLDTTKYYWLMVKTISFADGTNFCWLRANASAGVLAVQSPVSHSDQHGGTGWTAYTGTQWFRMDPTVSRAFCATDPKAMDALGRVTPFNYGCPIESTIAAAPAVVKTREAMFKYMVNNLYAMSKPRSNYSMATVTAPNVPIYPGDSIIINDEILGFSRPGKPVVVTKCGDMTYSWGTFDGAGISYDAPTKLSINPVGLPQRYN
jgi:hypothetical protein